MATDSNTAVRRALFVVTALATGLWLLLIVAWHDAPFALTFDDAWYYLTIGRNLAEGQGSTFDGINLTNGYHPLWMLVNGVPFALGLDDLSAARAVLVFQVIVGWGVTFALASSTVAQLLVGWPGGRRAGNVTKPLAAWTVAGAMVVLAASPFVVKVFVNGMESGIAATCDAALLFLAVRHRGRWLGDASHAWRLGVSVLLAGTFLARTDAILLLGCLGLWCLAEWWKDRPPQPLVRLVELFALPALTIAGYLAYNRANFGTAAQVSGLVKRAPLTATAVLTFAVFVAVAALAGWRTFTTRDRARHGRFPATGELLRRTGWFGAFCILLVGYYLVLQTQQWNWYYAPVVLYAVLLFTLTVADMAGTSLRDAKAGTSTERALLPVQIIIGVMLVALLAFTVPPFLDPNLRSIQIANADTGAWMRRNLPDDAVIASWDAGALGYFSHRHVVNIDGVVNSYEFHQAQQQGAPAVARFLACQRLGYVANLGGNEGGEDPDIRSFLKDLYGQPVGDRATVAYTEPFTYSGVLASGGGSSSQQDQPLAVHVYRVPDLPPEACPP